METYTCSACGKEAQGGRFHWDDYSKDFTGNAEYIQGYLCHHCGAYYCKEHQGKELGFSFWTGWKKTICPSCQQAFGPPEVFLGREAALYVKTFGAAQPATAIELTGEAGSAAPANQCPECSMPLETSVGFCPACGYDFKSKRKGVGPAALRFEAAPDVYQPSGKVTVLSVLLMLVLGVVTAYFLGSLLYFIGDTMISNFGSMIAGEKEPGYIVLMAFVAYVLFGWGTGYLVGAVVGIGARLGKSRSPRSAAIVGFLCGVVAFLSFLMFRQMVLKGAAYNTGTDFMKLASYFSGIVVAATFRAHRSIATRPFCEGCKKYLARVSLMKAPVWLETQVMELLKERRFADLQALSQGEAADQNNYTELVLHYCEGCEADGLLSAITKYTRYKYESSGATKTSTPMRKIFDTRLQPAEIAVLLG